WCAGICMHVFFFSSRRRHTRSKRDWSSDVCSSDLTTMTINRILFTGALIAGAFLISACQAQTPGSDASADSASMTKEMTVYHDQIGRASCRERVEIAVGAGALKKKQRAENTQEQAH